MLLTQYLINYYVLTLKIRKAGWDIKFLGNLKKQFSINYLIEISFSATKSRYSDCLLYTSPSPRDYAASRMPSSA
ncbi:hypothetical protein JMUB7519_01980 [Staphylococcus aureus]